MSQKWPDRGTHTHIFSYPHSWGLAHKPYKARIRNGAFSNEIQGERRERRVPFDIIIHRKSAKAGSFFCSLQDLCAKYLFHLFVLCQTYSEKMEQNDWPFLKEAKENIKGRRGGGS